MTEATIEKKIFSAKENMEQYFRTHDVQFVAENAVFINMGSGERTVGRTAIADMLHYVYHIAFDAKAEVTNTIITENKALLEARFKGTHIGEFAGISVTNKTVDIPLIVSYDLEDGLIVEARIYMLMDVMKRQLS